MKVAINTCYGGFGLSHAAVMRYAKLAGITLYPFVQMHGKDGSLLFDHYRPSREGKKTHDLIFYSTKPLTAEGKYEEESWFNEGNIKRNDPLLVQVIEEMGDDANGYCASIGIVEIPDDVKWEISEYDGAESVEEVHRSWP